MAIELSWTKAGTGGVLSAAYAVIGSGTFTSTFISYPVGIYADAAAFAANKQPEDTDYITGVSLATLDYSTGFMDALYAELLTRTRYSGGTIV
jgi:hypothetical protein